MPQQTKSTRISLWKYVSTYWRKGVEKYNIILFLKTSAVSIHSPATEKDHHIIGCTLYKGHFPVADTLAWSRGVCSSEVPLYIHKDCYWTKEVGICSAWNIGESKTKYYDPNSCRVWGKWWTSRYQVLWYPQRREDEDNKGASEISIDGLDLSCFSPTSTAILVCLGHTNLITYSMEPTDPI